MDKKHWLGKKGEDIAVEYLEEKGYQILERNWRLKKAEIDIICTKDNTLIFVEVKTKSYQYFGKPEESITQRKEELWVFGAFEYAHRHQHEGEIRFDIISILWGKNTRPEINHFQDVIEPGT